MANQEHLDILKQGIDVWNEWRKQHPEIQPDLYKVNLSNINLRGANLRDVNFFGADLRNANLFGIDLRRADLSTVFLNGADLTGADLRGSDLYHTWLTGANLSKAHLNNADLSNAHLRGADLSGADLSGARLVETDFTEAILTNCRIYGISAWDVQLKGAAQFNLVITHDKQATITVDNLKMAQFIYLLLNNQDIRDVINTITSKVVLILGRFTPKRKEVLDAIRDTLRKHDYLPVLFDFDPPQRRDLSETAGILARLSRFVIADLTEPKSIPHELYSLIPDLRNVPFQPLLEASKKEYPMFEAFWSYPWVLPIYRYSDGNLPYLLAALKQDVIDPAEKKVNQLAIEKAKRLLGK